MLYILLDEVERGITDRDRMRLLPNETEGCLHGHLILRTRLLGGAGLATSRLQRYYRRRKRRNRLKGMLTGLNKRKRRLEPLLTQSSSRGQPAHIIDIPVITL